MNKLSFEVIVACDEKNGIGKNGVIPWKCIEDLNLFRKLTLNSVLIMGRKTVEKLPLLAGRKILCLTRNPSTVLSNGNNIVCFSTAEEALSFYEKHYNHLKLFIAGGERIYSLFLTTHFENISKIHFSRINGVYECDTVLGCLDFKKFVVETEVDFKNFQYRMLIPFSNGERQYIALMNKVLNEGETRICRNGETKSLFCEKLVFDLKDGFPLLTTKKMFLKGIIEELLFFLKGQTDTKILENKNVNIWKGNTDRTFLDSMGMKSRKEGMMGPMYGYQWRNFNAPYDENTGIPSPGNKGFDQLQYVVNTLKTDPFSRRILMTTYNPSQVFQGVLFPCHSIVNQFYVNTKNELEMSCYNRSQDLFLGTPFNIASSALLFLIIGKLSGLQPRKMHLILGDVHLYKEHFDNARIQISRFLYSFPKIEISNFNSVSDLNNLSFENFILSNYLCHESLKSKMIP